MGVHVVLDTNVWVSAFLNPKGHPARLIRNWTEGKFTPVISIPLLEELADVLVRPRLIHKYGYTPSDVALYLSLIFSRAHVVPVRDAVSVCRDPKDNVILATAANGRALVIVTRDDDLKNDPAMHLYAESQGFRILSVSRFLGEIEGSSSSP